jgi:RHS repeat-associated protein
MVYVNDNNVRTLESTNFGGGRINKTDNNMYDINYFITDHLGSTRVIVGSNGEIKEQKDYYPFGKEHENPNLITSTNRYTFSGKEKQTVIDLGFLDFGARMLETEIGRWFVIDPLAEKYYSLSPYAYCAGNPVNRIDPDGMFFQSVYGDAMGNYYDIKGGMMYTGYIHASIFVSTSGEILRHFDDGDPRVYIVPDDWTGNRDELEVLGYEHPMIDYSANVGKNIEDVGYRGSVYPNDPPIIADYTLDALAVPIFGWLKFLKLGKLFNFAINKGGHNWVYGKFKSEAKWVSQFAKRGWTPEKVTEAIKNGKSFNAINMVNKGNGATRYVHPITGQSVVIDNVTNELLQVGDKGFKW